MMNQNSMFDFNIFIEAMRTSPQKCQLIEDYSKYVEPIPSDVFLLKCIRDHTSRFLIPSEIAIDVPPEAKNLFDFELLLKLAASSFSSDVQLNLLDDNRADVRIKVRSSDDEIEKVLSELCIFQIYRLYEIYIEEQMQLEVLVHSEEREKFAIMREREQQLSKWNAHLKEFANANFSQALSIEIRNILV